MKRVNPSRLGTAGVAGALVAAPAMLLATGASAEPDGTIAISVDQTENLSDGQTVTVTSSDADPDSGYYLAVCEVGTEDVLENCISGPPEAMTAVWVSNQTERGAQVPIAADGSFSAEMEIVSSGATFGGGDAEFSCDAGDCAVTMFHDHMNGFDVVAAEPVTFDLAAESEAAGESAHEVDVVRHESDSITNGENKWWGAWVGGSIGVLAVVFAGFGAAVSRL